MAIFCFHHSFLLSTNRMHNGVRSYTKILYSTALAEITLKLGKTAFLSIYDKTAHITHPLID